MWFLLFCYWDIKRNFTSLFSCQRWPCVIGIDYWYKNLLELKVVSAIFSLVSFVYLKETTCETRKNVFYFTSKALFRSWDNQILTFQIFKYHDIINAQAWNTKRILLNNLASKQSLIMKFGLVYVILQNKISYQKILWKMWLGNKFQALFNFHRIIYKKEFEEASMLI